MFVIERNYRKLNEDIRKNEFIFHLFLLLKLDRNDVIWFLTIIIKKCHVIVSIYDKFYYTIILYSFTISFFFALLTAKHSLNLSPSSFLYHDILLLYFRNKRRRSTRFQQNRNTWRNDNQ